jgi:hypothetical protein
MSPSEPKKIFTKPDPKELTYLEYRAKVINHVSKENADAKYLEVVEALILYFFQHPRFEEEGHGSLKKGIYLVGGVGAGKTFLMSLFQSNAICNTSLITTNDICDLYQDKGLEAIREKYIVLGHSGYMFGFIYDDLGAERIPIKHMGNEMNVMERIILGRYEYGDFFKTHFTSNLDAVQIEATYGTRVKSRLKEMCNFFVLPGTDRRK